MLQGITWYHHSAVRIDRENLNIYIDPWQIPASPVPADIILVTHDHFDHYSPADITQLSKDTTQLVVPRSLIGQASAKAHALRPGETIQLGVVTVTAVAAYNLRKTFHPIHQGWLGYIIGIGNFRYYHAGDSDFTPEMRDVRADVAFLPVGGNYTMDATEAAQAARAIRPQFAIPIHWGKLVGEEKDARLFVEKTGACARLLEKGKTCGKDG